MTTRAATAAATRQGLLVAAAELLDAGGPEAVTLREVGAKAGVSRSAPYRHFVDKDDLMAAVGAEAWDGLTARFEALSREAPAAADARDIVRDALLTILEVGRDRPDVYRVMFTKTGSTPAIGQAADRAQEAYLKIIARVVGDDEAWRYGGLLLTGAHGMALLELSGHLAGKKWPPAEELIDLFVALLPQGSPAAGTSDDEP